MWRHAPQMRWTCRSNDTSRPAASSWLKWWAALPRPALPCLTRLPFHLLPLLSLRNGSLTPYFPLKMAVMCGGSGGQAVCGLLFSVSSFASCPFFFFYVYFFVLSSSIHVFLRVFFPLGLCLFCLVLSSIFRLVFPVYFSASSHLLFSSDYLISFPLWLSH